MLNKINIDKHANKKPVDGLQAHKLPNCADLQNKLEYVLKAD